jgi:hypothetical protein
MAGRPKILLAFRLLNPFGSRAKPAHAPQVHSVPKYGRQRTPLLSGDAEVNADTARRRLSNRFYMAHNGVLGHTRSMKPPLLPGAMR